MYDSGQVASFDYALTVEMNKTALYLILGCCGHASLWGPMSVRFLKIKSKTFSKTESNNRQ